MKAKIVSGIIAVLLIGFGKNLSAQTFPYWDVQYPGGPPWTPTGNPNASMVATNGMVFVLGGAPIDSGDLQEWTQSQGWQTIASFGESVPDNLSLNCMILAGDSLYVVGNFTSVNNPITDATIINCDNVAKYNLTTQTWTDLGQGALTYPVGAITVDAKSNVYICCLEMTFTNNPCTAFSPFTDIFLEYNGTNWSTVGGGLAGLIAGGTNCDGSTSWFSDNDYANFYFLATDGTNIFLADDAFVYGVNTNNIWTYSPGLIRWDGTNSFHAMGSGPGLVDADTLQGATLMMHFGHFQWRYPGQMSS